MFIIVSLFGFAFAVLIYYKIIKPAKYWEEKDVVHAKSWPLVGSMSEFVRKKKHIIDVIEDIYKEFPSERCVGFMQFTTPFLMIRDLDLIKQIGVKDFDHFHDHLAFDNLKNDSSLSKILVSLGGEDWKQMRATLSSAFTSSKMKIMYQLMTECAKNFVNHFLDKKEIVVDMTDISSRFANDVMATTAFGIEINSFDDPNNEFFKTVSNFTKFGFWKTVKFFIIQLAPALANLLRLQLFTKDASTLFRSIVKDNISKRESEGIVRPDLIHLLMETRNGRLTHEEKEENLESFATVEESDLGKNAKQMQLTDDHIVAQALLFFFTGFDTVSTAACFMAHELAVNPRVQKKLQREIDAVNQQCNGQPSYETLLAMKYLDQVVCETLRMWPPSFKTDRLCVKSYVIEPKLPKEKVVFVEKGISIFFPIMAIHRDTQYYEEPHRFDPERFNDENKKNIVSGAYLPFGIGPRNCIGLRFALLEVKTLFFHLLSKFILVPVDETEIPLKISPKKINMAPEIGFKLALERRKPRYKD